jgi:hypothetical protein
MQRIGKMFEDGLKKTFDQATTKPKKRGGVNSERADLVEQLCVLMREDPKARMKYWLGRTRKLPPAEIYRLMRAAKDGKNPAALFNHLLKNYGKPKAQ